MSTLPGAPRCPHCELPLTKRGAEVWVCGICSSSFIQNPDHSLENADHRAKAKAILQNYEMRQGDHVAIDISNHDIPAWKKTLSLLGIPVEELNYDTHLTPWVGFALLLTVFLVYLKGEDFQMALALDPTQPGRAFGLNFLSYALAHGGALHLIGNVVFVLPFLDNSEDTLGHRGFAFLVAASALVSGLGHFLFDRSGLPLVGLSGVCFAIMTFYAVTFPQNRFLFMMPLIGRTMLTQRLRIRARTLLFIYATKELIGLASQLDGKTDVSHLGHLGGALTGLVFAWLHRRSIDDPNV